MILKVFVKPNKKGDKVYWKELGLFQEESILVVETRQPPLDGRANEAVLEQVANFFHLKKSHVTLVAGYKSKHKTIEIEL